MHPLLQSSSQHSTDRPPEKTPMLSIPLFSCTLVQFQLKSDKPAMTEPHPRTPTQVQEGGQQVLKVVFLPVIVASVSVMTTTSVVIEIAVGFYVSQLVDVRVLEMAAGYDRS